MEKAGSVYERLRFLGFARNDFWGAGDDGCVVGLRGAPDEVEEFDHAHARLLADRFPDDLLRVPHRIYAVIALAPPEDAP